MSLRYLSISQLSEITGKDRRTVSKRLAALVPQTTKGNAQLYSAPEAIETIFVSDSVEGMDKKLIRVQLAIEEEKLQKIKIENGVSLKELVPVEDVAKAVEKEYSIVRSQIRALPSKMAKPLSMVTEPNEIYSRLQEAVDEVLLELTADAQYESAKQKLEFLRHQAETKPSPDTEAIAAPEPGAVGGPVPLPEPGVEFSTGEMEDDKR
jgi:hypothetical protein